VNPLRTKLSRQLRELSVEEHAWPGRDDGFANLLFEGNEFAHFHDWHEIDIRLGKELIAREHLVRQPSRVHPKRAKGSPWYEMKLNSASDVDEVVRLVKLAILGLGGAK
jgi:hypothetical protein